MLRSLRPSRGALRGQLRETRFLPNRLPHQRQKYARSGSLLD